MPACPGFHRARKLSDSGRNCDMKAKLESKTCLNGILLAADTSMFKGIEFLGCASRSVE